MKVVCKPCLCNLHPGKCAAGVGINVARHDILAGALLQGKRVAILAPELQEVLMMKLFPRLSVQALGSLASSCADMRDLLYFGVGLNHLWTLVAVDHLPEGFAMRDNRTEQPCSGSFFVQQVSKIFRRVAFIVQYSWTETMLTNI